MARVSNKNIILRAFKIENSTISEPHSSLLSCLEQILTPNSKAGDRRLQLNEQDDDCELLSNFDVLRSGDSRLILLIHSPDPLIEHGVQISLKYKGI